MIHVGIGHLLLALVAAAGAGAPSASGQHAAPTTRPAPVVVSQAVCGHEPQDAAGWSDLFTSLDGDWAGGDAALSLRLPDGRMLWFFGDSFVGEVRADGSRDPATRLVRNAALVTDGSCATAATPGRETLRGRAGTWLWPTSMVLLDARRDGAATVAVFAQRMASTGTGPWDFRRTGASVATVTVPTNGHPRVTSVRDLPRSDVLWGAGSVRRGADVFVYGTRAVQRPLVFGRELLVARARASTVLDAATWTYRTATGWSPSAAAAAAVVAAEVGVSTNPTVVLRSGRFRLVTKPQEYFDDRVVVMTSTTPYGPWTSRTLFRARSTAAAPTYSPTVVDGQDIVVVSRTSTSLVTLMRRASAAVPMFRDVDLGRA